MGSQKLLGGLAFDMAKGEIKVRKRSKDPEDLVSFDPRMSNGKKTFVVVGETSSPTTYFEWLNLLIGWAYSEMEQAKMQPGDSQH